MVTTAVCEICSEGLATVTVPTCPLTHSLCPECWQGYLRAWLASASAGGAPLRCPQHNTCHAELTDLAALRGLDHDAAVPRPVLDALDELLLRRVLQREGRFVQCPAPGCGCFVEPPPTTRQSDRWHCRCPNQRCAASFCSSCRRTPYHFVGRCDEQPGLAGQWQEWRLSRGGERAQAQERDRQERNRRVFEEDERRKEETCRLCPHCRRVVERIEGCTAMRCGYDTDTRLNAQAGCGQAFNWEHAPPYRSAAIHSEEWRRFAAEAQQRARRVHHGDWLRCDSCGREIEGLRFQCVNCPAFNCCEACEPRLAQSHTAQHVFRIHTVPEGADEVAPCPPRAPARLLSPKKPLVPRAPEGSELRPMRTALAFAAVFCAGEEPTPLRSCLLARPPARPRRTESPTRWLQDTAQCTPWLEQQQKQQQQLWQWASEGRWNPYAPDTQRLLHEAMQAGRSQVQFMLGRARYRVDLCEMQQTNLDTGRRRPVRTVAGSQACPSAQQQLWQWAGEGRWYPYAPDTQGLLCEAMQAGRPHVAFMLGRARYRVDFCAMQQTNLDTGRRRAVRTVAGPQAGPSVRRQQRQWEWWVGDQWVAYPEDQQQRIWRAYLQGGSVEVAANRNVYRVNPGEGVQTNTQSGTQRQVRLSEC